MHPTVGVQPLGGDLPTHGGTALYRSCGLQDAALVIGWIVLTEEGLSIGSSRAVLLAGAESARRRSSSFLAPRRPQRSEGVAGSSSSFDMRRTQCCASPCSIAFASSSLEDLRTLSTALGTTAPVGKGVPGEDGSDMCRFTRDE